MKNRNFLLYIIFFIFFLIQTLNSQQIYSIDKTAKCEPYIGETPCDEFLDYDSIYTTATQTQAGSKSLSSNVDLLKVLGEGCNSINTFRTACSFLFPKCVEYKNNNTNEVAAFPVLTCNAQCVNTTNKSCKETGFIINCDKNVTNTTDPLFPIKNQIYNLTSIGGSDNYTIECNNPYLENGWGGVEEDCFILKRHPSTDHAADEKKGYLFVNEKSNCVIPNPVPLFTDKQWTQLYNLSNVLSVLSCLGALYLFITYNVVNPKISQYDKMHGFFNFSIFLQSLSGVIILFAGGPRSLIHDDGARISVWEDPLCSSTGFIFQLSSIMAIEWWVLMAFDLWYRLHFTNKRLNLMKFYVPFTITLALVFSIVPLATKNYRMIRGNMHCWVNTTKLQNGLFWIPLGIALFIGTCFLVGVIIEIYKVVRASKRGGVFLLEVKPILNIVLIFFTFLYLFAFNFYMNDQGDIVYGQIPDYFKCVSTSDKPQDCVIKGPSIGSLGFFIFCIRIYGVYCFFLQGLTPRAKKIWKKSWLLNNKLAKYVKKSLDSSSTSSTNANTSSTKDTSKMGMTTMDSSLSANNPSDDEEDYDPYHVKVSTKNRLSTSLKDIKIASTPNEGNEISDNTTPGNN
ncbi:hypothetical protein DICPUDRAFT_89818 [Dictyostelium purpureum]|uniref:G-protein coupled receptors family 2 profile 2 domain-containing protein n=1 Tax=Dictyostelium purpureum TaxID=5786 RepID=F0ZYD3_DICPU|nr:uncharacterized protein DICPUDRAFT_89818 [Dictyostelium purpureum]EGC31044.1 hypothetical protein DICPUDRAFT_89818 [Dictyostelium purpureum]|eukprot:XP_003292432.1 hypothetical protein DICPUDRAFT_89818 [Dictyostelium purpureum]